MCTSRSTLSPTEPRMSGRRLIVRLGSTRKKGQHLRVLRFHNLDPFSTSAAISKELRSKRPCTRPEGMHSVPLAPPRGTDASLGRGRSAGMGGNPQAATYRDGYVVPICGTYRIVCGVTRALLPTPRSAFGQ